MYNPFVTLTKLDKDHNKEDYLKNQEKNKNKLLLSLLKYFCEENNLDYDKVYTRISSFLHIDDDGFTEKYWKELLNFIKSVPNIKSKSIKNFTEIYKIGEGSFGCVFKAKNNIDDKEYAIKTIKINDSIKDFKECRIMCNLEHPNIVRYFGVWVDLDNLYLQMELCQDNLKNYVLHRKIVGKRDLNYFVGVLEGINYLHSKNIIHRDLKSTNILINKNKPKICDFNLSKNLIIDNKKENNIVIKYNQNSIIKDNTSGIGTELYSAPEQINGNDYDFRVDIYSLGIIYYELITIFKDNFDRIDKLIRLNNSSIDWNSLKILDKVVLIKMLDKNYKNRPTTFGLINIFNKRYKSLSIPMKTIL